MRSSLCFLTTAATVRAEITVETVLSNTIETITNTNGLGMNVSWGVTKSSNTLIEEGNESAYTLLVEGTVHGASGSISNNQMIMQWFSHETEQPGFYYTVTCNTVYDLATGLDYAEPGDVTINNYFGSAAWDSDSTTTTSGKANDLNSGDLVDPGVWSYVGGNE